MTKRTQNILFHIIGSLVFLCVPILNSQEFKAYGNIVFGAEEQRELLQFVLLLGFFYLNYFLLIPKLVFTKKYFIYAVLVLSAMFIISYVPHLLITPEQNMPPEIGLWDMGEFESNRPIPVPPPPPDSNFFLSRINHNIFLFLAVVSFSLLLSLRQRWMETEKEKLNAELQYLKAQINPHFLYNTLNSIYALALQKADNTADAVQQLSGLMRYILTESVNETVPLQKEIQHIESFIRLQQLRFGNEINLLYKVNGDPAQKQIAPLLLITFIENAFKYGINAEEDAEIVIQIDIEEKLQMLVRNKIVSTIIPDDQSTKMGLNITQERLNLHYPSAHQLDISEKDGYYTVLLTIEL